MKMAEKTRRLVNTGVGPYAQFAGARLAPQNAPPQIQVMLGNLAANAIVDGWVPQVGESAAEESFFKINQAATPIDPTEKLILQSRYAPSAVAARAIVRGGTGHKYWAAFSVERRNQIEGAADRIYRALYEPPIGDGPIKTLDLPVAGRGYSALPFVFELVGWANDLAETTKGKIHVKRDPDGAETVEHLRLVERAVNRITGTNPEALGLHPVVYFYTRGGDFQPNAFIAVAAFVRSLVNRGQLEKFKRVRSRMEDFLLLHKEFVTLVIKKTGAGRRSHGRLVRYLDLLLSQFDQGKSGDEVMASLAHDPEFAFLAAISATPQARDEGDNASGRFSKTTKSASFVDSAIKGAVRCGICGALVHRNSMQVDHINPVRDGGLGDIGNARITHPYCNSSRG
jgi:hypothetical protein